MPRATSLQTNFTAGEISPRLRGRIDINKYLNGAKRLKNFIVKPQGGLFRRTGGIFIAETKANGAAVLIEFEISDVNTYILEFGHLYMRVYRDGLQVKVAGVPYEIVTPYTAAEIAYLQYAQSADILYITHPAHKTQILTHYADATWTIGDYANVDGPYLPQNKTEISMQLSGITDTSTLIDTLDDFAAGDVGKFVEYTRNGIRVIGLVVANVSTKEDTITPLENVLAPLDPTAVVTYAAGVITSTLAIFSQNNVGSYVRLVTGAWYLISGYTDTTHVAAAAGAITLIPTTGFVVESNRVITATCKASGDVFVASDVGRHIRFNFSSEQVWGTITAYTSAREVTVHLDRAVPLRAYDARDPSPATGAGAPPPVFAPPPEVYGGTNGFLQP